MSIGRRSTSVATALGLAFCQGCGAGEVAEREAQPAIVAPEPTSFAELFQERGAVRLEQPDSAPLVGLSSLDVSADGRLVVADLSETNVKVYGPDGQLLHVLGRKGHGPGEFDYPAFPRFDGDDIIVADMGSKLVSRFDSAGEFRGHVPMLFLSSMSDFQLLPDGDYLFAGLSTDPTNPAVLFRANRDGKLIRQYLGIRGVTPEGVADSPLWRTFRSFYIALDGHMAYVIATISDSLWTVDLESGREDRTRLALPGYRPPPPIPRGGFRSLVEMREFAAAYNQAERPLFADGVLVIPFVRGVVAYGDPFILAIRQGPERWLYATDAPPLIGTASASFIGLREPLGLGGESIQIAFYRRR